MAPEYTCNLSDDLLSKAKTELNEDPGRRSKDIQAIREWIQKQPHLISRTDDAFILRFLRNCKFSLEMTKEKIDCYLTIKSAIPEWFTKRDPTSPEIQKLLDLGVIVPLPERDDEGRKVFIVRPGKFDPSKVNIDDVMKMEMMVIDTIIEDEKTQICGVVGVLDPSGLSGKHVAVTPVSVIKRVMAVLQDCQPMRVKSLNCYNEPALFSTIFDIMKLFMKEKMKRRVHFHGNNLKSLHTVVPRHILPEEYGGTAGKIQDMIVDWKKELMARKEQLAEGDQYGVNESKRPGKPKTKQELFGIEGSFRQLSVD